jgi:hypothetical protein
MGPIQIVIWLPGKCGASTSIRSRADVRTAGEGPPWLSEPNNEGSFSPHSRPLLPVSSPAAATEASSPFFRTF